MTRRETAYVLAVGALERVKWLRWSLCLRRCCRCERLIGVGVWPWSGALIVQTHTFCDPCVESLLRASALEVLAERKPGS
jgi:hypothetical protein